MRTYDILLNGTDETRLIIDYKFFLILADGGYVVDVSVWKKNGYQKAQGVAAGFGLKLSEDSRGKEFIFSSANAQTIKIFAGDDEAIYNRLSGTVTVNGGSLASLGSIGSIVKIADDGFSYGSSHKSNTTLGANGVETVFAPGSNINGAILHSAMLNSNNTGYQISMLAKSSAPTSVIDGDLILGGKSMNTTAHHNAELLRPVKIPAGKGLYFFNTNAENAGASLRGVLYTLL